MITLNVITPVTRPDNLPYILDSMQHELRMFKIRWFVIFDQDQNIPLRDRVISFLSRAADEVELVYRCFHDDHSVRGDAQRNLALKMIENDREWVYFLDDDNMMHQDFLNSVVPIMAFGDVQGIFVYQLDRAGRPMRGCSPESVKPCSIDTAQFVLRRDIIGQTPWPVSYISDGLFIKEVYEKNPRAFRFVDAFLCYYNALEVIHDRPGNPPKPVLDR